jgi:hypothetical protein
MDLAGAGRYSVYTLQLVPVVIDFNATATAPSA